MFNFEPPTDAVAITGTDGTKTIRGKVVPQLVDTKGNVQDNDAVTALTQAFKLKRTAVKDVKKLLELNGHKPTVGKGSSGKTKITVGKDSVEVAADVLSVEGKVVTDDDAAVDDLLNTIHSTFAIDKPAPKTAKDLLEVYGYSFQGAEGTAMMSEYSVPPFAVTNKSEFSDGFRAFMRSFWCLPVHR